MEIKKIKILLEDYVSRNQNNFYGSLTATTFNVNLFLGCFLLKCCGYSI